jgi:hypothetical protein
MQNSSFSTKNSFFKQTFNFSQKIKFPSKIHIFRKNPFSPKIEFFSTKSHFSAKIKKEKKLNNDVFKNGDLHFYPAQNADRDIYEDFNDPERPQRSFE